MYAIVKTGGKQYRVEQGSSLLIERLPDQEGAKVSLEPLLFVDGKTVVDERDGLSKIKVEAKVVGHERGPKLRVVKFKPKRGYKRRTGHRQELTRIEVTSLKPAAARATRARSEGTAAKPAAAKPSAEGATKPAAEGAAKPSGEGVAKPATRRRAAAPKADAPATKRPRRTTTPPSTTTPKEKDGDDGS